MHRKVSRLVSILLASSALWLHAEVRVPAILGENMVMQQKMAVQLWGWADTNETVTIRAAWLSSEEQVEPDAQGRWHASVKPPKAGGPYALTITGATNSLTWTNLACGEVWICSGQSNMEWPMNRQVIGGEEAAAAANPNVRLFTVQNTISETPKDNCNGAWLPATPDSVLAFSAVGYFFADRIQSDLGVPVGIISADWGGTPAEAWTSAEALQQFPQILERKSEKFNAHTPSSLFNGMIAPLVPFAIQGAIWYQGESNQARAFEYQALFSAMIEDWRSHWDREFPFYFVQIAPYKYGGPEQVGSAFLREAQLKTMLSVPKTGMAVTMDIANVNDIHPRNKLDVGNRLAYWALNRTYGFGRVVESGPVYRKMRIKGNRIRLYFDYAQDGLLAKGGPVTHVTIAGEDRVFVPAQTELDGKTLWAWSPDVPNPKAVRYGFTNGAEPNLFNGAGLPASSFRTDDWMPEGQ